MNTTPIVPTTAEIVPAAKVEKNNNANLHITLSKGKGRGKRGNGRISSKVVVSKGDTIKYVSRSMAKSLVNDGFKYDKKSTWRKVRDSQKSVPVVSNEKETIVKKKKPQRNDKARKAKETKEKA